MRCRMKGSDFLAVLVAGLAAASIATPANAQKTPQHRVVFELTSADVEVWESLLNNVENVQKALGPTSIEIVAHGKGLALLTRAKNSAVYARLAQSAEAGVVLAACENTMRRQRVTKDDLVPFARTVDSGLAQIVRKQEAGWSYVRSAP